MFPTIHVIGEDDKVITPDMSEELLEYFDPSCTVVGRHEAGHLLPSKGDAKDAVLKFLDQRMADRA